jgi:hypothetical protein
VYYGVREEDMETLDVDPIAEPFEGRFIKVESRFVKRNYNLTRDLDERLKLVVSSYGGLITETALVRLCLQIGLARIEREGLMAFSLEE